MRMEDARQLVDPIQRAGLDPSGWTSAIDAICSKVNAYGGLIFDPAARTPEAPMSASLAEATRAYLEEGWLARDARYRCVPTIVRQGIAVDQDFFSEADIGRNAYFQDFLGRFDLRWAAMIGFSVRGHAWVLSLQRTADQGPFGRQDQAALRALCKPLSDAAALSRHLSKAKVEGMVEGLDALSCGAVALDRAGRIVAMNATARSLLPVLFRQEEGRLVPLDRSSQARWHRNQSTILKGEFLEGDASDGLGTLQTEAGACCPYRMVPLGDWASTAFLRAAALVLIGNDQTRLSRQVRALSRVYALTGAEAAIVGLLARGLGPADIARATGRSYETVKSLLKHVYDKTEQHGQLALMALLQQML